MKTNYHIKTHLWPSLISILLLTIITFSCNKPNDMEAYDTYLDGTSWIWTKTITYTDNTMLFFKEVYYPDERTKYIILFENRKFKIKHNGNLIKNEKIRHCVRSESITDGWSLFEIKFCSGYFNFGVKDDTLGSGLEPFPLDNCYGIHGNSFPCPIVTYFVKM